MKKIKKEISKKNHINNIVENKKIQTLIYNILIIIDIAIIIFLAKHNYAHYALLKDGDKMFVGNTKNLLFGKNYVTIIITIIFSMYILFCNKFLFHKKSTKKHILLTIIFLLILNITLFYIFTKKIY